MYKVALVEDEKIFSATQEKICRGILEKLNIVYDITVFDNSGDFIKAFSQGQKRFDLLLLDIVMDGANGMDIAKMIREIDKEAVIIFITSSSEYVFNGYDVGALHYLLKPVDETLLEKLITTAYKNKSQSPFIIIKSGTQNQRISIKDIIALETVGRKVEITLTDKVFYYNDKLADLLNELPKEKFIRCHQSFAVNIDNIREINRFDASAVNGKKIPISRAYLKDVQTAFLMNMQDT
jgi:DNA-binding LytR/AlgR family response regulator